MAGFRSDTQVSGIADDPGAGHTPVLLMGIDAPFVVPPALKRILWVYSDVGTEMNHNPAPVTLMFIPQGLEP